MKMSNLKQSKKAFMATSLVDTWAYIVFVLVVLVFMILFALIKGCGGSTDPITLNSYSYNSSTNHLLLYFLKSPSSTPSQNMADLIINYTEDNFQGGLLEDQLEDRIQTFFNQNFQNGDDTDDLVFRADLGGMNFINSFWKLKIEKDSNSKTFKYHRELLEYLNQYNYRADIHHVSLSHSFGVKRNLGRIDLEDPIINTVYLPSDTLSNPIKIELTLLAMPNAPLNSDMVPN